MKSTPNTIAQLNRELTRINEQIYWLAVHPGDSVGANSVELQQEKAKIEARISRLNSRTDQNTTFQ